jgi:hypothetical protein
MSKTKTKLPKRRNAFVRAMFKRHGAGKRVMRDRRLRRAKDAGKSWRKDWEQD